LILRISVWNCVLRPTNCRAVCASLEIHTNIIKHQDPLRPILGLFTYDIATISSINYFCGPRKWNLNSFLFCYTIFNFSWHLSFQFRKIFICEFRDIYYEFSILIESNVHGTKLMRRWTAIRNAHGFRASNMHG